MTTITELIGELEALRAVYGDLPVLTRDCCGGLGPAEAGVDYIAPTGWRDQHRFALPDETDAIAVDAYHYRIVYRPETLIPDIDLRTSGQEG